MRNVDPFEFISRHQDTIFRILGILAALLAAFLLVRHLAMRLGGWRAAYRRVRREIAITFHAWAAPPRAWLRHRRSLRHLVRGLGSPETWRDSERAVAAARQAGGSPYAVLVDDVAVTVLLAGRAPEPPEDEPWWVVEDQAGVGDDAPNRWTVARADLPPVVPDPERLPPVLVAVGETGGRCVLLDVATGPTTLCAEGDHRSSVALHQAVAAQLDARLPEGMVVVAEGVHPRFPGQPVRLAYREAQKLRPRHGLVPVLVAAELPDPVPPELTAPPGEQPSLRLLLLGPGRGYTRTLLSDRHGQIAVVGTPLLVAGNALGRAIARVLRAIPPVLPPAPPFSGVDPVRVFAEPEEESEDAETVLTPQATVPRPPAAEADAEDEARETAGAPAPQSEAENAGTDEETAPGAGAGAPAGASGRGTPPARSART